MYPDVDSPIDINGNMAVSMMNYAYYSDTFPVPWQLASMTDNYDQLPFVLNLFVIVGLTVGDHDHIMGK